MTQNIFPVFRLYKTTSGRIRLVAATHVYHPKAENLSLRDVLQLRDDATRILTEADGTYAR